VLILAGAASAAVAGLREHALPAAAAVLPGPQWAHITDWADELDPHYDQASRMLGVRDEPHAHAGRRRHQVGRGARWASATRSTRRPVGVYFNRPGETDDDTFFGGAGPRRTAVPSAAPA
jgi:hypothetical protein